MEEQKFVIESKHFYYMNDLIKYINKEKLTVIISITTVDKNDNEGQGYYLIYKN
jgi:hypothetical protein